MFMLFFFFKQKTAYEMRISDWSSDVCSSDLSAAVMVPTVLAPGETLVATEGIKPLLAKVDVDQALRWREGFVEFSDSTLADAVAEMNRYSGKQIVLRDAATGNLRVSDRKSTRLNSSH